MQPFELQHLLGSLWLAALALSPPPLSAQERLDPVEVQSSRSAVPRVDVQRNCPGYGEALKESMARNLPYIDQTADIKVLFELKGGQVASVRTQGGAPFEYRRALRRSMQSVSCVSDGQPNQQYTFRVVFKPHADAAGDDHLAVIDGQALAQKD
ncbi:MAG: hypothetical protein ACOVLH_03695 [Roseateles sp.]